MKWRSPKEFESRIVTRFAWLPEVLESGETIWLEKFIAHEQRQEVILAGTDGMRGLRWVRVESRGMAR